MDAIAVDLNQAFQNGIPGAFAGTNLALRGSVKSMPEPSCALLLAG